MILIDTDICIELMRGNENVIFHRNAVSDEICISFMIVGELYIGIRKSSNEKTNSQVIEKFFLSVSIIESNIDIMKKYGEIRSYLEKNGIRLQDADILIAATSLIECEKLITGNINHYDRIPNLIIENWIS
jgi:tRNA(fMet)-specific endonuclease VapC